MTCLENDTGFENIFAHQVNVQADKNDILIALSGSGNSMNIVNALEIANLKGLKTFAYLHLTEANVLILQNIQFTLIQTICKSQKICS